MSHRANDSGFSVVEVLVALAIASIAIIALGGLLQLAVRANDTLATSKSVHAALLNLQGILQLFGENFDAEIQHPAITGFFIASSTTGDELARLELGATSDDRVLAFARSANPGRVDLAVFEEARLEYLEHKGPEAFEWVEAVTGTYPVLGARLKLRLGNRTWRPLLWIASTVPANRDGTS